MRSSRAENTLAQELTEEINDEHTQKLEKLNGMSLHLYLCQQLTSNNTVCVCVCVRACLRVYSSFQLQDRTETWITILKLSETNIHI